MNEFVTISEHDTAEIIEKKSRFIANIFHVENIEQVEEQLNKIKKQHYSARHNCYAYRIIKNDMIIEKSSDDGEPSGTAGAPMLNILSKNNLCNILIVVTRYFGGILLGTGGLVRAYSSSVQAGLASSQIVTRISGSKLQIATDYTGLGKIQYILGESGIQILDTQYTDQVVLEVLLSDEQLAPVQAEITEGTSGQAKMEVGEACFFAEVDGKEQVLE